MFRCFNGDLLGDEGRVGSTGTGGFGEVEATEWVGGVVAGSGNGGKAGMEGTGSGGKKDSGTADGIDWVLRCAG